MGLEHHWIVLIWSVWAVQFLTTKADDDNCTTHIQVRRNTVYEAIIGEELRIECPVLFCKDPPPAVNLYKMDGNRVLVDAKSNSRITTGWDKLYPSKGTFYLIFQNIVSDDEGEYRCEGGGSVSHSIFIKVHAVGINDTRNTTTNDTTGDQSKPEPDPFLMYMYSSAGIGSFVVIVIIISVICMQGCKGKSRKEKQKENQYIELPLAERAVANATGIQPSPRGSPSPLPPRRPSGRKTTGPPAELTPSRDNEPPYGQRTRERNRNGAQAEEAGSVVYAALNHAPPPREAPRPQRQIEDTEYAAIRLV